MSPFLARRIEHCGIGSDKEGLIIEIARFFRTGTAPVAPEVTVRIFAFMEAAEESKRRGGKPISIENVLKSARDAVRAKADLSNASSKHTVNGFRESNVCNLYSMVKQKPQSHVDSRRLSR